MTSIDTATGTCAPAEISTARVYQIFSGIAKKYERFNAISSFGAYKRWLGKMAALAHIEPHHRVLDIAGGTGDVSFTIAKMKHPAHILCTDLVPEMLEIAQSHYHEGKGGTTQMDFQVADAQKLPFDNNSFDAVTMAYGLRNMPERERALSEILRVLKPGGQLICLDFSTPSNKAWNALYRFYLDRMIPMWGRLIAGNTKDFVYLANSIKAFPDQQGVADLMEHTGFKDVSWENCTGGIACIHSAFKGVLS